MPDPTGRRPDRNLALELVRVTEYGALAAARWVGLGEKESADGAAVDAMRLMLDSVSMDGVVVIGEGEKDEAPMLYNGERIRFIEHGDVSAALLAVQDESPVDLLWGIGGTPEGVISAASIKCMGGQLLGRLWPRNDGERQAALDAGYDLDEVLDVDRLVAGQDVFFAATGVTDGDVLDGVHYTTTGATTESLVMRSRSGTVRRVTARHDRAKLREITGARAG